MSTPIYYQFPLRFLAWRETPKDRMHDILCYCRLEAGFWEIHSNPAVAVSIVTPKKCPVSSTVYRAFQLGAKKLHIEGGDVEHDASTHSALKSFCSHNSNPFVRIRSDWFWNCVYALRGENAQKPMSYREFTVLCAILSKVGTKGHSPCTWQEIRRRALGYTTEAEMQAQLPSRTDGAKPLSRQQIRTTLGTLEVNKFFARSVVYAGEAAVRSHYSFSMERTKLASLVAEKFGKRRKPMLKTLRERDKKTSLLFSIVAAKMKAEHAENHGPLWPTKPKPPRNQS